VEQYVKQPNGEWLLFEFLPSTAPSSFLRSLFSSIERGLRPISFDPHNMSEDNDKRKPTARPASPMRPASLCLRACGGITAGWLLDRWLGTKPWLLVTGLILGGAAGFL
jgi:hypothetical protein